MPKALRLIVLAASLLAAACVPESEQFLSEPGAEPLDTRLVGMWYFRERRGHEATIVSIRKQDDTHFAVTWVDVNARDREPAEAPTRWLRYTAHTTRLGKDTFINLENTGGAWPDRIPARLVVRYWVEPGKGLRIAFMHYEEVKKAIETGALAGKVEKSTVRLTAGRAELVAWIRRLGPDKAFGKPSEPLRPLAVTEKGK